MVEGGGTACTLARTFSQWRFHRYRSSINAQLRSGLAIALQKAEEQEACITALRRELEVSRQQLEATALSSQELERATGELQSSVVTQHQLVDTLDDFKAQLEAESAARSHYELALQGAQSERASAEQAERHAQAALSEVTADHEQLVAALAQREEQLREALDATASHQASPHEVRPACHQGAQGDDSLQPDAPSPAFEPLPASAAGAAPEACSAESVSNFVILESSVQLEPGADGVSCLAAATSQQCLGSMLQSTGSSARRQLDAALRRVHMLQGCQKDAARLQRSAAASRAAASAVMKRAAERCCAAQQKLAFAAWWHCSSRTKLTGRVRAAKQEAHDTATWFCTMQQRMAIYVTGRVAHARKQALAEALSRWRLRAFKRARAAKQIWSRRRASTGKALLYLGLHGVANAHDCGEREADDCAANDKHRASRQHDGDDARQAPCAPCCSSPPVSVCLAPQGSHECAHDRQAEARRCTGSERVLERGWVAWRVRAVHREQADSGLANEVQLDEGRSHSVSARTAQFCAAAQPLESHTARASTRQQLSDRTSQSALMAPDVGVPSADQSSPSGPKEGDDEVNLKAASAVTGTQASGDRLAIKASSIAQASAESTQAETEQLILHAPLAGVSRNSSAVQHISPASDTCDGVEPEVAVLEAERPRVASTAECDDTPHADSAASLCGGTKEPASAKCDTAEVLLASTPDAVGRSGIACSDEPDMWNPAVPEQSASSAAASTVRTAAPDASSGSERAASGQPHAADLPSVPSPTRAASCSISPPRAAVHCKARKHHQPQAVSMAGPPQWKISSAYPKRQDPGDLPCTLRAITARVRSSPATGRVAASALSAPAAARVPKWLQGEQGSKAVAEHKRTQAPGTSRAYLARESCPEVLRRLQRLGIQQDVVFDGAAADGSTRVQKAGCVPTPAKGSRSSSETPHCASKQPQNATDSRPRAAGGLAGLTGQQQCRAERPGVDQQRCSRSRAAWAPAGSASWHSAEAACPHRQACPSAERLGSRQQRRQTSASRADESADLLNSAGCDMCRDSKVDGNPGSRSPVPPEFVRRSPTLPFRSAAFEPIQAHTGASIQRLLEHAAAERSRSLSPARTTTHSEPQFNQQQPDGHLVPVEERAELRAQGEAATAQLAVVQDIAGVVVQTAARISEELRSSVSLRTSTRSQSASGAALHGLVVAGRSHAGAGGSTSEPSTCKVMQPTPVRVRVFGGGGIAAHSTRAPPAAASLGQGAVLKGNDWHDMSAVRQATEAAVTKADAAMASAAGLAQTLRSARPVPHIAVSSPAEASGDAFACQAAPRLETALGRVRSPTFASMAKTSCSPEFA